MSFADLPVPLNHPQLGRVQGRYGKGVIQYLGLKYASLDHRFAEAKLVAYDGLSKIDATRHGPPVPTLAGATDMELSFIQAALPKLDVPTMSDIEGLNLNITVPSEPGRNLPVLVYIHGGGFTFGSNSYPHYDQSKMVELSVVMGQPMIAVNINYRLNVVGFLDSQELRKAGYQANRGLRDQRVALQWIKKYISGFGGGPHQITVLGQSAGAASVNFQMHSEEPLFSQAILLGGSFLMMKPATEKTAEQLYEAIIQDLGLSENAAEDRVRLLRTMPAEKLVSNLTTAFVSLGPVVDHDFVPAAATFSGLSNDAQLHLPGRNWCQRLLVIDSQLDGSIFGLVNLNAREKTIVGDFPSAMEDSLGKFGEIVTNAYEISEETLPPRAVDSAVRFVTDISFYAAAVKIAETWPGKSYVCHFNEGNPFPGHYKGRASHLLDTAYLWGNYNQTYPRQCWAVARAFAEDVVAFATCHDDLPVFNDTEQLVRVYGPSERDLSARIMKGTDNRTERNHGIFSLAEQVGGLDALLDAMMKLLGST